MKPSKNITRTRSNPKYEEQLILQEQRVERTFSTPEVNQAKFNRPKLLKKKLYKNSEDLSAQILDNKSPREGESPKPPLSVVIKKKEDRVDEPEVVNQVIAEKGDESGNSNSAAMSQDNGYFRHRPTSASKEIAKYKSDQKHGIQDIHKNANYSCIKCHLPMKKCSCKDSDIDEPISRLIRDVQHDARKSSRIIRDSKARLLDLQKKPVLTDTDVKEISERNELLLREMDRFDKLTRTVQKLVDNEVLSHLTTQQTKDAKIQPDPVKPNKNNYFDQPMTKKHADAEFFPIIHSARFPSTLQDQRGRSKSEVDLSRKLSESYDMQEKLVADNADLEVKRYILYKELMTKDQNLETCRAQIKRLQGEMKMMGKENALLMEKLNRNHPEGDATTVNQFPNENSNSDFVKNKSSQLELIDYLKKYKESTAVLEKQVGELEYEVRHLRIEMAGGHGSDHPSGAHSPEPKKPAAGHGPAASASACSGAGGKNTCYQKGAGPPAPPMTRACGVCPPCPAPCNPDHPPTPAEREVVRLTIQLKQTEENFKTKITECAVLRADLVQKKEELEKERCQHRELKNKMRELEMKYEGLTAHTNMLLGTKEQALETEVNVRALKQCYREAKQEIDELRILLKEQNEQIQDYRSKYLQAQQLVEEQRRQMDIMDMDNTRISEQINLEIQRVKIKFQEKLQELAPIPELLKGTQARLKDAQQSQAIAEHNAEQLARELNCAREKVHVLLHNSMKAPEKPEPKGADDKQMQLLQQRITQLTENNVALKTEVDRLKANVIRMEEAVLANEKRLQEKMHECAALGGELDRARDEAARALQRANERTETIRKCLQTTVAELERQLAASRAQVKTAEKDREEIQCRMQCQIQRLNENFEQAQLRIMGLTTQVMTLRRTVSSNLDEGEGQGDQECACKTVFDKP